MFKSATFDEGDFDVKSVELPSKSNPASSGPYDAEVVFVGISTDASLYLCMVHKHTDWGVLPYKTDIGSVSSSMHERV